MKKSCSTFVAILGIGIAFSVNTSCNNAAQNTQSGNDTTLVKSKQMDSVNAAKRKKIAFDFETMEVNLPDHFDVVRDITSRQIPFKAEFVNPITNADNYTTSFKKEVNMGIYGVDLMYVNFYGKNQDLINNFGVIRKLAKDLNFDDVFDKFADRFQSHSSEKDTVIKIVDSAFNEGDDYLNKNDRYMAASHIFAGAIIEVNFLSLNLLNSIKKSKDYDKLLERVYGENRAIYDLINLFEESGDDGSKELLESLKAYKQAYDEVIKSPADLTHDNVAKAIPLITDIRNKLVGK